jgi:hypothetical protein
MKIIRYFFYKIYSFSLSNGENDAGWAMAIVSIFGIQNVYGVLGLIQILFKVKTPQIDKWIIILLASILLYSYYVLLVKNGKAKEIVKEFKEMKGSKLILNLLLALYIIGSIGLFIYTGNIVRELNQ